MTDLETVHNEVRATQDRVLILEESNKGIRDALDRIFAKLVEIGEGKTVNCVMESGRITDCEKQIDWLKGKVKELADGLKRPWITASNALITAGIGAIVGIISGILVSHFTK